MERGRVVLGVKDRTARDVLGEDREGLAVLLEAVDHEAVVRDQRLEAGGEVLEEMPGVDPLPRRPRERAEHPQEIGQTRLGSAHPSSLRQPSAGLAERRARVRGRARPASTDGRIG